LVNDLEKLKCFQNKLVQAEQEKYLHLIKDMKIKTIQNLKEQTDKIKYSIT
jgi:hypothetical protein